MTKSIITFLDNSYMKPWWSVFNKNLKVGFTIWNIDCYCASLRLLNFISFLLEVDQMNVMAMAYMGFTISILTGRTIYLYSRYAEAMEGNQCIPWATFTIFHIKQWMKLPWFENPVTTIYSKSAFVLCNGECTYKKYLPYLILLYTVRKDLQR
jgi:hypothetical protein